MGQFETVVVSKFAHLLTYNMTGIEISNYIDNAEYTGCRNDADIKYKTTEKIVTSLQDLESATTDKNKII